MAHGMKGPFQLADEGEVKIEKNPHLALGPMENEDGTIEMRASTQNPDEDLYFKIYSKEQENPGLESFGGWKQVVEPDYNHDKWPVDAKDVEDVKSPSYEEMDELREKYEEQLEQAETDEEHRNVLEKMWEEAAETDLEGYDAP